MATLVQFLVAGVKGAESGSATFLLRGSVSSAAAHLYNDFERTAQPGTNIITLDSNGAAEVYCSVYCDVVIKNSAGTTLRTVTVGNGSSNVEVRSSSFKGDDYDGSPSNTASQPITLTSVLDLWSSSAGTTDFKVLFNGVATNLQSAIAGFSGLFTNVKDPTYGAVGDGVTDDTTAIAAAISASAGGIVFFPPGTYKITQLAPSLANLNLMGAGPGATVISSSGATALAPSDTTAGSWKNIQGIKFTATGGAARFVDIKGGQNFTIKNCDFDATNCSSGAIRVLAAIGGTRAFITDCKFTLPTGATTGISAGSAAVSTQAVSIKGCVFVAPSGFTGVIVYGCDILVEDCLFDASAVTSGTYYHIDAGEAGTHGTGNVIYTGIVTCCRFVDGGSSGFAFFLPSVGAGTNFIEDDNTFTGFVAPINPTSSSDAGHIYSCTMGTTHALTDVLKLGSRDATSYAFTNAATANLSSILCQFAAETIVELYTNAGNHVLSFGVSNLPVGVEFTVIVRNESGGARDITFSSNSAGSQVATESAVPDGGRAYAVYKTYLEVAGTEASVTVTTKQSPN